ncbi:hypothetical protein LFZ25_03290 [Salmonella enterica subsp. enterica serovar Macclesfield str. S-1643]|uniref:Uncharacterized protein n=1 Tax=Salmonella enterica subsp. enterica serovar Macclesfield str. S-1643 TaxID=1242107 RepID=A0A2C9NVM4_SALET|nr:hypothetical protein LFZ25_03290 [Salmonella enterica subsp. enterica serovar Macclesfield str. S-1643]
MVEAENNNYNKFKLFLTQQLRNKNINQFSGNINVIILATMFLLSCRMATLARLIQPTCVIHIGLISKNPPKRVLGKGETDR